MNSAVTPTVANGAQAARYKSRRERNYDDNESEDEFTKNSYQDTHVAQYEVKNTQGQVSAVKPHPMFKNNRG
jgi:hypothetical protein